VAIERRREPFGYGPAYLVVLFLDANGREQHRDRAAWDVALDDWLVAQQVRALDDAHETHRTALRAHDRFEALLKQYGDGRFNVALMSALRGGPLVEDHGVSSMLAKIHKPLTEQDAAFARRVAEVDHVLARTAQELTRALGYSQPVAERLFGAAVALYLNERFRVSELPTPPAPPRQPPLRSNGTTKTAKYELKTTHDGKFHFVLKAANGEVVLSGQTYSSKASARDGIESVRKNAPHDERFERKTSSKGQPYFVLHAANKQVVGESQMYSSTSAMEADIASVKTAAPEAEVAEYSTTR
jgi:uncharacterized protein YegP (UPF0339 family)